jgi:hypothetical protein
MKTRIAKLIVSLIFLVLPVFTLYAQEGKAVIPAEIQKLNIFLGNWKGDMSFSNEKGQNLITTHISFHAVAGGCGVIADESMPDPTLGEVKGVDIFGYDPYAGKLHCFTVDNAGTAHDHICTWKSDQNLYMEHNSVRNGKKYSEKINCLMMGKDAIEFKAETFIDGKVSETMAGVYRRVQD